MLGVEGGRVALLLGAGPVVLARGVGVAVLGAAVGVGAGALPALAVGVGVGVGVGLSVRIVRGAIGTPARVSTGP